MPDTEVVDNVDTGLETEAKWYDGQEAITSNADVLAYARKYDNPGELAKAGHGLEQKLGGSYRLPDDLATLNEDQKADILTKVRTLRSIPESADGYEITVPDGVTRDDAFEGAFKALMHKQGRSQEDVQELADFYSEALAAGKSSVNQKLELDCQTAETAYRIQCGAEYDQKMKEVGIARMGIAKDLGCTYKDGTRDESGIEIIKSRLDDALDVVDANGRRLGNNPIVLQMLNLVHDKLYKEAVPVDGGGSNEPGAGGDGVFSNDFYNNKTA